MKFKILELGFFSLNSYVYYLTRGFITSARVFDLLTRPFNLATCAFSILTRGLKLVTRVLFFHSFTCPKLAQQR